MRALALVLTLSLTTAVNAEIVSFPNVSGENLNGESFQLPRDFYGKANLVLIAYEQEQQEAINTWFPIARELAEEYPKLHWYELPTIATAYWVMKPIIDNGMRSGIESIEQRGRTITIFTNREEFNKRLRVSGTDTIRAVIVQDGKVTWRVDGEFTEQHGKSLRTHLKAFFKESKENGQAKDES